MTYAMTYRVDEDGVLRLALELGEEYANKFVRVTVESIEPPADHSPLTDEERKELLKNIAGKWLGEFERPPQGDNERREELPGSTCSTSAFKEKKT
jgi:hypothetical protein